MIALDGAGPERRGQMIGGSVEGNELRGQIPLHSSGAVLVVTTLPCLEFHGSGVVVNLGLRRMSIGRKMS